MKDVKLVPALVRRERTKAVNKNIRSPPDYIYSVDVPTPAPLHVFNLFVAENKVEPSCHSRS